MRKIRFFALLRMTLKLGFSKRFCKNNSVILYIQNFFSSVLDNGEIA